MQKKEKYIVGTNSLDYNPKRNFGGLPFSSFTVVKKMDLFRILDYLYFKLKNKSHPFFSNAFCDLGWNRVDLFHFFNSVSFSNKPWLVTYENEIPRPYLRSKRLVKRLVHPSCVQIIAFCNRARQIELFLLDKYPQYKALIQEKIIVLQPAQSLHIQNIEEKDYSQPITFTFVGVDFFRKGGAELLKATEQLISEGYVFRLNIVSKLQKGSWKDHHITSEDILIAKRVIEKYPEVINYQYTLNSEKVIGLFKESHVGLLPSYGETYGYVVLEAQACGCPVITPNMPPFEEFNSNEIGWLLNVPTVDKMGTRDSDTSEANLGFFRDALSHGLYVSMKEAIQNIDLLKQKASAAILHIKEHHSPEKNARLLEDIYLKAIKKSNKDK